MQDFPLALIFAICWNKLQKSGNANTFSPYYKDLVSFSYHMWHNCHRYSQLLIHSRKNILCPLLLKQAFRMSVYMAASVWMKCRVECTVSKLESLIWSVLGVWSLQSRSSIIFIRIQWGHDGLLCSPHHMTVVIKGCLLLKSRSMWLEWISAHYYWLFDMWNNNVGPCSCESWTTCNLHSCRKLPVKDVFGKMKKNGWRREVGGRMLESFQMKNWHGGSFALMN